MRKQEQEQWVIICDKCHKVLGKKYTKELVRLIRMVKEQKIIEKLKKTKTKT